MPLAPAAGPAITPSPGIGNTRAAAILDQFHWVPQPEAWKLANELIAAFLAACPFASDLSERMRAETATRFIDWVDTIEVAHTPALLAQVQACGWEPVREPGRAACYRNPRGIFPRIVLAEAGAFRVHLKVERVTDFLVAHALFAVPITGEAGGQLRFAAAYATPTAELWVVERHGYTGYAPPPFDPTKANLAAQHTDRIRRRQRDFTDDAQGFEFLWQLLDAAIADLGQDWTCDIFFACEREYWQLRNHAARVQYARQQELGLGWANHDHHTYRCSREHFQRLMATWIKLGFVPRERFYAGLEAGWGAQVMEQHVTGITTFNDVDLTPDELSSDYFNEPLPSQPALKTVGLWCGLHGESVMLGGMHHLEAMFSHDLLVKQLDATQVKTMVPFTAFSYLKQSFTEGQRWKVAESRLQRLLDRGLITSEQANAFRSNGAIGSHLENLERNDGFKGFNQQGVSDIIARTDPRRLVGLQRS